MLMKRRRKYRKSSIANKLKKHKKSLKVGLIFITLFLSQGFFMLGFRFHYIGLHNIDLAWNAIAKLEYNFTSVDIGSDFQERTLLELYIIGINQTENALVFIVLGSFFLIIGIDGVFEVMKK